MWGKDGDLCQKLARQPHFQLKYNEGTLQNVKSNFSMILKTLRGYAYVR